MIGDKIAALNIRRKKVNKDYYSEYSKDFIENHFSADLNYFGYGF